MVFLGRLVKSRKSIEAKSIGKTCSGIFRLLPRTPLHEMVRITDAAPSVANPMRIWSLPKCQLSHARSFSSRCGVSNERHYWMNLDLEEVCPATVRVRYCHRRDRDSVKAAITRDDSVLNTDNEIDSRGHRPIPACRRSCQPGYRARVALELRSDHNERRGI